LLNCTPSAQPLQQRQTPAGPRAQQPASATMWVMMSPERPIVLVALRPRPRRSAFVPVGVGGCPAASTAPATLPHAPATGPAQNREARPLFPLASRRAALSAGGMTLRPRRLLLLTLAAAVLVVGVYWLFGPESTAITYANARKIQLGMTLAEVE